MPQTKMSKDLFEQVLEIANSNFERIKDVFALLPPRDVFIFSYINGFRDAYDSYASDDDEGDTTEFSIGDIVAEIPSSILPSATSGAEREYKKYTDKIKSMQNKEIFALGFQSGFESGFGVYSYRGIEKDDIPENIKYYHSNFDRLH